MTEQRTFSTEGKLKLTHLINEGMNVLSEMEALRGGLNDTVKAIAEELEVKPSVLKKAIRIAHKAKLGENNQENQMLNEILQTVGRTL